MVRVPQGQLEGILEPLIFQIVKGMKVYLSREEQNRQFHLGYTMAFGAATKRRNWNNIVALWRSAATQGHKRAQFYLGTCYDHGRGVKKDIREAFKWFLKAAKQGHMESQYNIGFFFREGELVKQDFKVSFKWFSLSAIQGYTEAQRDLGYAYFYGEGTKKDSEKAIFWYRKAVSKNDSMALYNLALCYKHGDGVGKSVRWAKHYFLKASLLGNKRAGSQLKALNL